MQLQIKIILIEIAHNMIGVIPVHVPVHIKILHSYIDRPV
jgi:hypothetical protein